MPATETPMQRAVFDVTSVMDDLGFLAPYEDEDRRDADIARARQWLLAKTEAEVGHILGKLEVLKDLND